MATTPQSTSARNGTERRRHPRYEMALDVAFGPAGTTRPRPSDTELEHTVTVNLSVGGLCMYTSTLYPVGADLFCRLSLPHRKAPLEVVGTVAWFQKVERDEHGYKVGVEFSERSPEARAALQEVFKRRPKTTAGPSRRLLLVEDDAELRRALQLRFEASGFQVTPTGDGLEALCKARQERPDVVVLDIMLPRLNGYEVCRLLKFDPKFQHVPVVFCTARSRQEDVALGRAVGADAYVTKPFDGKALLDQVESVIAVRPS